jgi:fructosamine-3-kinase
MFEREAEGLRALAIADGPRIPEPLLAGQSFLLLEDLRPARPVPDYDRLLGVQLAALHAQTSDEFGFEHDNFIGSTPQPNPRMSDGFEFFAEHRLLYQAGLGLDRGELSGQDLAQVRSIARGLRELIPDQPASLIHGDLWSGNAITGPAGEPAIIDPATHYGWAEAELGMTSLFGGFSAEFYRAYGEVWSLEPSWRERLPVYNLYHLLNHVNLFGAGYLGQVRDILRRYS